MAAVSPERERYGSLPDRLADAWRQYKDKEDRLSLGKDIELIDAISQIFQNRLKVADLGERRYTEQGIPIDPEADLYDKLIELSMVRLKLVEAEDKRAYREKQYYTSAEMAMLMQAFVMAINEEAPDVRRRIQERLTNSPIGTILSDPR